MSDSVLDTFMKSIPNRAKPSCLLFFQLVAFCALSISVSGYLLDGIYRSVIVSFRRGGFTEFITEKGI